MSTNKHTNPAYISHVHLKGYKSIFDTEVELHPGLNIIIGPNGSGKTNFLEFLERLTSYFGKELIDEFDVSITINENNNISNWKTKYIGIHTDEEGSTIEVEESVFYVGGDKPKAKRYYYHFDDSIFKSPDAKKIIKPIQPVSSITFGIPYNVKGLNSHINLNLKKNEFRLGYWQNTRMLFIDDFILNNFLSTISLSKNKLNRKDLLEALIINEDVKRNLNKFSIIEDLRLEQGISSTKNGLSTYINHIGFEFLVNNAWLTWDNLSDGTKRLFYLITQVTLNKGLCLVEEPELGVHPNQYRKILNFLKEQAEHKQVIITTHAPKTLDILDDNELDRIILTRYDNELGTKMRHLDKEEIVHAVKYMLKESLFLSDFWTLTSFFDEEEAV